MKQIFEVDLKLVLLIHILTTNADNTCDERFSINTDAVPHSISSYKDGDYIIHSLQGITNGDSCTEITNDGFLRIMAVKYALERANSNITKHYNVTLGWRFDDTCLSSPIAMSHGIKYLNTFRKANCLEANQKYCSAQSTVKPPIAVVGGYFSFTALPLASLFSLEHIPQISYGASTPLLSKTNLYPSFFRTISPDTFQIEAMLDILDHFNWKFVFAIGSADDYGKLSISELKRLAPFRGICVAGDDYIPFDTVETQVKAKEIVQKLKNEPKARVVIMFNYALGMGEYILKEAELQGLSRIWLTSEAWNPEVFFVDGLSPKQLESIITVSLSNGPPLPGFLEYINRTITNIECDQWLQKAIEQNFDCNVHRISDGVLYGDNNCSVLASDISSFLDDQTPSQVNNLIDAVDSITFALQSLLSECTNASCILSIHPSRLTEAMKSVHFVTQRNRIFQFDEIGNPAYVHFSIEQVQLTTKELPQYVYIGSWTKNNSLALQLELGDVKWPNWTLNNNPTSICSSDCPPGMHQVGKHGCCWECRKCPPNTFSDNSNADECKPCAVGYHTLDGKRCLKKLVTYLFFNDAIGLTTSIISFIGIALTLLALIVYLKLLMSAIPIEMSPQGMMVSFLLLFLSFLYFPFHIYEPAKTLCQARDAYFHLLLSFYNTFLLLRNTSVTRFLSKLIRSNKEKIQMTSAILFLAIQLVQVVFLSIWFKYDRVSSEEVDRETSYFKKCILEFTIMRIVVYTFPTVVLVVATTQSLSERQSNISSLGKYLYYTCFALCIANASYIITLNYVVGEYQALVSMLTMASYAFIYLFCIVATCLFEAWIALSMQPKTVGVLNIGFEKELVRIDQVSDAITHESLS